MFSFLLRLFQIVFMKENAVLETVKNEYSISPEDVIILEDG